MKLKDETLSRDEEATLRARFDRVRERLGKALRHSGRKEGEVRLLAISKWQSLEKILCLARYWKETGGFPMFGENYAQEALTKQKATIKQGADLGSANWHFTGQAQSNKARILAGRFGLIHSLDSLNLAQNLQKTLDKEPGSRQAVLIQVNLGRETGKAGVSQEDAAELLRRLPDFPAIEIRGLMCLPPYAGDPEASRPWFIRLRQKRDAWEKELGLALPELSMGMSHDFEAAVEEGATLVRVGTDIFGPRIHRDSNL
ncbi:MAG: YggS family pyridoxal phosphate-dependent enzyme [Desulfovibrionaceae bacterium]|nr:YggS family pyridoxal phosphate-dependent enzyme [Desulfovibrionaceae bacterium]